MENYLYNQSPAEVRSKKMIGCRRGILSQGKQQSRRNTLCISRLGCAALGQKNRRQTSGFCKDRSHIKKGAGRNIQSPCYHSRFALSDAHAFGYPSANLGRQNLAALGTTAGKNLAAVGSSHSLTETVNLAAVTAAGLIGTLHVVHLLSKSHMLNSPIGRSNA